MSSNSLERKPDQSFHVVKKHQAAGVRKAAEARAAAMKSGFRMQDHPSWGALTFFSDEEEAMIKCILEWRCRTGRLPTHTDVLLILKGMGYVRVPDGHQVTPIPADVTPAAH